MAGTLTVQTLQGPSSGANANKVIIPSGHTLSAEGHVVQVVQYHTSTTWTVSATEAKLFDKAITTKLDNSDILAILVIGRGSQNSDTDIALAMGYKSGSPSSSTGDYTSLHTSNYTRQLVSNLGSFWAQDTSDPNGGNWNGNYNISAQPFNRLHSPNVTAGTTLNYSVWASSDGTMRIGNSYTTGTNGYDTTLTLMEIAQ